MSASNVLLEVKSAMYAKLTGDSVFMGLITTIGDEAPDAQPLPYVSFGPKTKTEWFTFGKSSWEVHITLNIWTAIDDGDKDLMILGEMDRLLNNQKLSLVAYDNAQCFNDLTVTTPDETVYIKHIAVRYLTRNSLL